MNTKNIEEIVKAQRPKLLPTEAEMDAYEQRLITTLTQHHQAEAERAVEAERERIRVFVANNYRIDYATPAIDLEVIMEELAPLPKQNTTSDK